MDVCLGPIRLLCVEASRRTLHSLTRTPHLCPSAPGLRGTLPGRPGQLSGAHSLCFTNVESLSQAGSQLPAPRPLSRTPRGHLCPPQLPPAFPGLAGGQEGLALALHSRALRVRACTVPTSYPGQPPELQGAHRDALRARDPAAGPGGRVSRRVSRPQLSRTCPSGIPATARLQPPPWPWLSSSQAAAPRTAFPSPAWPARRHLR